MANPVQRLREVPNVAESDPCTPLLSQQASRPDHLCLAPSLAGRRVLPPPLNSLSPGEAWETIIRLLDSFGISRSRRFYITEHLFHYKQISGAGLIIGLSERDARSRLGEKARSGRIPRDPYLGYIPFRGGIALVANKSEAMEAFSRFFDSIHSGLGYQKQAKRPRDEFSFIRDLLIYALDKAGWDVRDIHTQFQFWQIPMAISATADPYLVVRRARCSINSVCRLARSVYLPESEHGPKQLELSL